ncbi:nuclear transport factor 2 family protein [Aureibaculum luteum]|uniref:nuclear transport factor 2 family protein n=1 Tax=Aureibaculum luteum TaxID=1548456 RepID=UPI0013005C88|nr:nuclear transport factor 2 family protein [Aureibaculum luteum]
MRILLYTVLFFFLIAVQAQSNTEVFLVDIIKSNNNNNNNNIELANLQNISNNEAHDNQPNFFDANTVMFSSTRDGQTDIRGYGINNQETSWLTDTPFENEYSPLKIPNSEAISAVHLDNDGLQRLYQYDLANGTSKVLLKEIKVGYNVWFNSTILISSVLVNDKMDLVVSNLDDNSNITVAHDVGRSIHKIPNSGLVSFISYENNTSSIKSLDPISGNIKTIKSLPIPIKDICWLVDNIVLIPNGKKIVQLNINDDNISVLYSFKEKEINEISRISISPDNKHLVFVSEESPEIIVQKQVEAYNKGNWEEFASYFSENITVKNFPDDTLYEGNSKLKSNYKQFFSDNPKSKIKIVKRISNRNIVIDEELITINGEEHHQSVLYKINKGEIISMYFIRGKQGSPKVEAIVQKQFDTWNEKDIDNFVKTFSDDIKVYEFQNKIYVDGQKQLYDIFSELFTSSPDLHCEISNRIIIGNTVIDKEVISDKTEDSHEAIVIYEVENGKIFRMTTLNN